MSERTIRPKWAVMGIKDPLRNVDWVGPFESDAEAFDWVFKNIGPPAAGRRLEDEPWQVVPLPVSIESLLRGKP